MTNRGILGAPVPVAAPDAVGLDQPAQQRVARAAHARVELARELDPAAGVERRQDRLPPGRSEHGARGRGVGLDVPLGLGLRLAVVAEVDAAVHAGQAQLAGDRGSRSSAAFRFGGGPMAIRVIGSGDAMTVSIRAWTPSFSTLARVLREIVALHPLGLRARVVVLLDTDPDRDVGPPRELKDARHQLRSLLRVAEVGHDELHVELRRLQGQGERPRVVDVVADVGVEDDGDRRRAGRGGGAGRGERRQQQGERENGVGRRGLQFEPPPVAHPGVVRPSARPRSLYDRSGGVPS